MRIAFRTKAIPVVATVLLVALGISLGRWQDSRAEEKRALAARIDAGNAAAPLAVGGNAVPAGEARYRRVAVTGTFVKDWPVYLDNRPHAGRAGFVVLMPFRIDGTPMHVLVARGWLPRDPAERTRIPAYPTPAGIIALEGVAKPDAGQVMQLGTAAPLAPGAIVQNADAAGVAQASGLAMQPFVVEQTSRDGSENVLVRDWPRPDLGIDKHRGYAFQWYALALMAFLFFIFSGIRSGTKPNHQ